MIALLISGNAISIRNACSAALATGSGAPMELAFDAAFLCNIALELIHTERETITHLPISRK